METVTPAVSNEPKKNIGLWVVAGIVVIGIIFALTRINNKSTDSETMDASDTSAVATDETASMDATTKATAVTTVDADASLLYTAALSKYAGRRVQFSTNCAMTPAKATFKAGTKVMLDNRGSSVNTVTVGDSLYRIQAYNFAFITLADAGTLTVSCGSNNSAGTITVTE